MRNGLTYPKALVSLLSNASVSLVSSLSFNYNRRVESIYCPNHRNGSRGHFQRAPPH